MRIFIFTILFLLTVVVVAVIRKPVTRTEMWQVMGTFATVTISAGNQNTVTSCMQAAKTTFAEIERDLSAYSPDSDISRINKAPAGTPTAIGIHAEACLRASEKYYLASNHRFDPTVGPLMKLWGFRSGNPTSLPSPEAVKDASALCGFTNIVIGQGCVTKLISGIRIDLGGIGKGYAVDVCYDRLKATGAGDFIINLGGNMRCSGRSPSGNKWRVAVKNPFDLENNIGAINMDDGMAVATSGSYERFVTIDGVNYSHIMDPLTGRPATGMASVTVICPTATDTDGLSTALFLAGPEAGMNILTNFPGTYAIFIPDTREHSVILSPGTERLFTAYSTSPGSGRKGDRHDL